MNISKLVQWGGPAAILTGLFMVMSDLSGMGVHLPDLAEAPTLGSYVIGSGLVLFALVLLLVGMIGLYVRLAEAPPNTHRIEEYEIDYLDHGGAEYIEERLAPEELRQRPVGERIETVRPGAGMLVLGTGLLLFFMFHQR